MTLGVINISKLAAHISHRLDSFCVSCSAIKTDPIALLLFLSDALNLFDLFCLIASLALL